MVLGSSGLLWCRHQVWLSATLNRQNNPHFRHVFPALSSAFVVNIERLAILEEIGGRHEFCQTLAEPEKREEFDAE